MKLNISYPVTARCKKIEIEDDKKLRIFYDKRIAQEVEADTLGEEWKGYILKITGGNDKQGFPMLQGVLTTNRVRLLLKKGSKCYRPRKRGQRKRKSVRGCIVDANLSSLNLIVLKKGEQDIPGLTDSAAPRPLGPRIASKIRKLFNLSKEDDVRKFVIPKIKTLKNGKKKVRKPRIQRLVTPADILKKQADIKAKQDRREKRKTEREEYNELLTQRLKEAKQRMEKRKQKKKQLLLAKQAKLAKTGRKRSRTSSRSSTSSKTSAPLPTKLGKAMTTPVVATKAGKKTAPGKGPKTADKAKKPVKATDKTAGKGKPKTVAKGKTEGAKKSKTEVGKATKPKISEGKVPKPDAAKGKPKVAEVKGPAKKPAEAKSAKPKPEGGAKAKPKEGGKGDKAKAKPAKK